MIYFFLCVVSAVVQAPFRSVVHDPWRYRPLQEAMLDAFTDGTLVLEIDAAHWDGSLYKN